MLTADAKGVCVICPTPFTPDGALDETSAATMTEAYVAAGATGLTILGIMGEAPKLDQEEAMALLRVVLRHAQGLPVIVGVSAPGYAPMRALAARAMEAGAAGVMIAPPSGLRGDDAALAWLQGAAEAVAPAPWVLQDFPQANGVHLSPRVIAALAADPRCVMLKAEDWPGLDKIATLVGMMAKGEMRRIAIYGGNGGLFLPEETLRGADGVMTGYAFPEMLVRLRALLAEGQREAAMDLFEAHLPLIRTEHQPGLGLAVRKYVLARRGIIAHPTLRAPAPKLSDATRAEVEAMLARLARRDPLARLPAAA
ncbi:dihydrodipicolinate synthase family protein [Rubritepida flocculans]|uniref:dihydrodipicolinate synthase family protein n=1 Tax=Rubritepida flocculans TaxID=182403 RepID=UPI0004043FC1|nr:dihydrodipicolinate synthase family protein [Rubritepida flocculans]